MMHHGGRRNRPCELRDVENKAGSMRRFCWSIIVSVVPVIVGCSVDVGSAGIGGNLDGEIQMSQEYSVQTEARRLRDQINQREEATVEKRGEP